MRLATMSYAPLGTQMDVRLKHPSKLRLSDIILIKIKGETVEARIVALAREKHLWYCTCISSERNSYDIKFDSEDTVAVVVQGLPR